MTLPKKLFKIFGAIGVMAFTSISPLKAAEALKPLYGNWGFDFDGVDTNVNPGDDFFLFSNGKWIENNDIPSDRSSFSVRVLMTDAIQNRLLDLLKEYSVDVEHQPESLEGKVGAFYKSFMNETHIEHLGVIPIRDTLDAVSKASTHADICALMGRNKIDYFGSIFSLDIDADAQHPNRYAVYLRQSGLGLPDREYYLKPDFAAQKAKYEDYAGTLLRLIGWDNAEFFAEQIVRFEERIAEASWTPAECRDSIATYNPMSLGELENLAPQFSWNVFFQNAGLEGIECCIVSEKSAFPKIAAIFAETSMETLRAWLAFSIVDSAAPYLSHQFVDANFEMYGKVLTGQMTISNRSKLATQVVSRGSLHSNSSYSGYLSWLVGRLYSTKYFPAEVKSQIKDMAVNLREAFRARIKKLDWMKPETKAYAIEKLDNYAVEVGYPDKWLDYPEVAILDDDLIGNVRRAAEADWQFLVEHLPQPVDRSIWYMTPHTNNAYHSSLGNIVFPAGILQPPIFDPVADPAINYGAIGGIIGHELTHGFDDEGRKYDANGMLRNWWSEEESRIFEERAKVLSEQYSSYEPVPGVFVNGDLTMGENIADLGGLTLAIDAYVASLNGKPDTVIDGLTGIQRVFLGWSQTWRGKAHDDATIRAVMSDPHSPRMYRVNGVVRNIDAWYEAFDVKPGDKLYLAPEDRVRIW